MIGGRSGAEIPPQIPEMRRPRSYGDSASEPDYPHRAVRTDVRQQTHNKSPVKPGDLVGQFAALASPHLDLAGVWDTAAFENHQTVGSS